MIVEDDPCGDAKAFVLPAVGERLHEDVAARCGREDGQPLDHGGGDEVGGVGLSRVVAAAHDRGDWTKHSFGERAFPSVTWERVRGRSATRSAVFAKDAQLWFSPRVKRTLTLPESLYRRAKARAARNDTTIDRFVTEAVKEKLNGEKDTAKAAPRWMKHFGACKDIPEAMAELSSLLRSPDFRRIDPR